jgi:hypothetical protein
MLNVLVAEPGCHVIRQSPNPIAATLAPDPPRTNRPQLDSSMIAWIPSAAVFRSAQRAASTRVDIGGWLKRVMSRHAKLRASQGVLKIFPSFTTTKFFP